MSEEKKYYTTVKQTGDDGVQEEFQIYVVKPSNAIVGAAEAYRASVWKDCLKNGVFTKFELNRILKDRGIWNEDKEVEEKALKKSLTDMERELFVGKDGNKKKKLSEGQDLAISMRKLRNVLREHVSNKLEMEANTAEAISENARFDYYVANCTFDANFTLVYKDIDEYNSRSADATAFAAASKLGEVMWNLNGKFERNLPENRWLVQFGLVDDDLSLVNKQKKNVDTTGRLIDKEGYLLNADGQRVDEFGNPVNNQGQYDVAVEYEDDLETTETSDSDKGSEVKP